MNSGGVPSYFPSPADGDDDDVVWAMQTALVQWKRGGKADAVVWIRRAADSAEAQGAALRAGELRDQASALAERMWAPSDATALGNGSIEPGTADDVVDLDLDDAEFEDADDDAEFEDADDDAEEPEAAEDLSVSDFVLEPEGDAAETTETLSLGDFIPEEQEKPSNRYDHLEAPRISYHPIEDRQELETMRALEAAEARQAAAEAQLQFDGLTDDLGGLATVAEPSHMDSVGAASEPGVQAYGDAQAEARPSAANFAYAGEFPSPQAFDGDGPSSALDTETLLPEDGVPTDLPGEDDEEDYDDATSRFDRSSLEPESQSKGQGAPPIPVTPESTPPGVDSQEAAVADAQLSSASAAIEPYDLADVNGFRDLPPEVQAQLAHQAKTNLLKEGDEVAFFGAALVTAGRVKIAPTVSDLAGAYANPGEVIFTRGTIKDGVELRAIASEDGTKVATWEKAAIDEAVAQCPWVADDLRHLADRYHALCGASLGVLSDGLDESLLMMATERMQVAYCAGLDVLVHQGQGLPGIFIVGAGRLEVLNAAGEVAEELVPGDLVYAREEMAAEPAPATVRGGPEGAVLLMAPRKLAHELVMTIPPLLDVVSS